MHETTAIDEIAKFLFEFLVMGVIVKYIIVHWVAQKMLALFKFFLLKTQRHVIYWAHFHEKAIGKTHQYATPEECRDGICRTFGKDTPS